MAGEVIARAGRLWVRVVDVDGRWCERATAYRPGEEPDAERFRVALQGALDRERLGLVDAPTVEGYGLTWLASRRARHLASLARWKATGTGRVLHRNHATDEGRFRRHITPHLGQLRLVEVRPRDVLAWLARLETSTTLAPKSRREVYALLGAMFQAALLDGSVAASPCVAPMKLAGELDPDNPGAGRYSGAELATLVGSPSLSVHDRLFIALGGLAGLRLGAAVGLRWADVDSTTTPLWRITSTRTYAAKPTKTGRPSTVPVHPVLRDLLTAWRSEWPAVFDRDPTPADLVLPRRSPRRRRDHGTPHSPMTACSMTGRILRTAGVRPAPMKYHGLRSTFVSLAVEGGASRDAVRRITHTEGRRSAFDAYDRADPWPELCAAVLAIVLPAPAR